MWVEKIIGRGSGYVAVEIPFTPRIKIALRYARETSESLNSQFIGTEHLLLGILKEGNGVAISVLQNMGVNQDELKDEIIKSVSDGSAIEVETDVLLSECDILQYHVYNANKSYYKLKEALVELTKRKDTTKRKMEKCVADLSDKLMRIEKEHKSECIDFSQELLKLEEWVKSLDDPT